MTVNKTIYKQYDSRWGSKYYPTRGTNVGNAGCGLLACTHVAMEQESKKNWTPNNLRSWMVSQGFALAGQGTKWEGITQTLKHIGHDAVIRIYADPMSKAFEELDKGDRIGVILFDSNLAPDGTRWTGCGHYVAFTDYKVENGKHWFYTKDSGGRDHSGWYSYERSMKGCIPKIWIVKRVGAQVKSPVIKATTYKPTKPYTGTLPTGAVRQGNKGTSVKAVQAFLNWCIRADLDVDGIAGEKTDHAIRVYQKTYKLAVDGIFGVASKKKAKAIIAKYKPVEKTKGDKIADTAKSYVGKVKYVLGGTSLRTGIDCTGFIIAIYGLNGIKLDNKLSTWGKSIGTDINKAKAGDILTFKHRNGKIAHHAIYVGNGMAVHASTRHRDWHKDIALSEVSKMSHPLEGIRRRWE